MERNSPLLSFKEKVAYGFGDLASVLYWQTFMLYFTYFFTDVFIIPASVAATMFLVSRVIDGLNDPLMGIIADRTQTRWGKFRPYLLWLCVPFAISGVLVFTVPNLSPSAKIIWAYSTFILVMIMYTAINIPYTALMGVISPNSQDRTSVSSFKFIFAFAAGIIVSATLLPLTKGIGSGDTSIITAEIENNVLTINEAGSGNAMVVLSATNPDGIAENMEFWFRVDPASANFPALKEPIDEITLQQGFGRHVIDVSDVFVTNDQKPLEYAFTQNRRDVVNLKLENKTLVIEEMEPGTALVELTASDKVWGANSHSFYVHVNEAGNSPPEIADSTDYFILEQGFGEMNLDVHNIIVDPDGDPLTFGVTTSDASVLQPVMDNGRVVLFEGRQGFAELTIVANDGRGGQQKMHIGYYVSGDRQIPPLPVRPLANVVEREGFGSHRIDVSGLFMDPDGKPLQYSVDIINHARGWNRTFMIYGAAAILFFLIAFKGTRERVQPPQNQQSSIKKDLHELVTNVPWLILLATTLTFVLFVAIRGSVTAHYFKYVIGAQELTLPFLGTATYSFESLVSAYNTIGQLSSLIGVVVILWVSKMLGKKKTFILFFIISIMSTGLIYFLSVEQLGLIYLLQITGSLTGGPLSVLLWAMYADTADYGEWKRGRRATGLVFSASTMSQKFGWAFAAFISLTLMAGVGFEPNVVQSADSLRGLILLFTLIPAVVGAVALLIYLAYPLNDQKVKQMTEELEARRNEYPV